MANVRLLRQRVTDYVQKVNRADKTYQKAATVYNTALQNAMDGNTSLIFDASGNQVVVGGQTPDGQLALKSSSITDKANLPSTMIDLYIGVPFYVRDASGNVAEYQVQSVTPPQTDPAVPQGPPVLTWVQSGNPLPSIPSEPVVEKVNGPNLTVSNINELESPSSDQALLNLQAAAGLQGKSELAGDVPNSANSAFADPEDPNDMASRGILARTLAGQLG